MFYQIQFQLFFHCSDFSLKADKLFLLQIRRQAIKELPRFATGENILRVADILTQLLQTGMRSLRLVT